MSARVYKVKALRRPTPEEIAAHERIKAMEANQLPAVRKVAEKWRNGVGLSGAAVSAASLMTSPDILNAVTEPQRFQGGLAVLVALVAALAALATSLRASIGWPKLQGFSINKIREWERSEVRRSICFLKASMWATLVAIAAAVVAVAVLLFGFYAK